MIGEVSTRIREEEVSVLSNLERAKEISKNELLLDKLLSSDIKADLLALFHNNPGLIDGMDGVASRIGRKASEIETDVGDLIDVGILHKKRTARSEVLYCDSKADEEAQQVISNYLNRDVVD